MILCSEVMLYWDLFQKGNQDRSVGNTESLWVIPFAFMTPGGGEGGPGVKVYSQTVASIK
jgi:hypothetical protein